MATMISNMPPLLSKDDNGDGRRRNAKPFSYSAPNESIGVHLSDAEYFIIGELRMWMTATLQIARAALLASIDSIIAVRPEKQMLRVAARRIVAAVTDYEAVAYRAYVQFVSKTMRPQASIQPIALSIDGPLPHPAPIGGFSDTIGEVLTARRPSSPDRATWHGAVFGPLGVASPCDKWLAAGLAMNDNLGLHIGPSNGLMCSGRSSVRALHGLSYFNAPMWQT